MVLITYLYSSSEKFFGQILVKINYVNSAVLLTKVAMNTCGIYVYMDTLEMANANPAKDLNFKRIFKT